MTGVAERAFATAFARTFSTSGVTTRAGIARLGAAMNAIRDPAHRALAEEVFALVRHRRKLDQVEVAPARRALARLLDHPPSSRLPVALERALHHAVPRVNADVRRYELSFDLSGGAMVVPGRAVIRLARAAPEDLVLAVAPDRLNVREVHARGRAVPFSVRGERLHVRAPGATAIEVRYTVRPTENPNGPGLIADPRTGSYSTFTWPYGTGALFPSNPAPEDGVTARVTVEAGRGRHVVGAGAAGRRPIRIDRRVPAYAIAFYAGRFARRRPVASRSGVTVTLYGHGKSVRDDVRRAYQRAAAEAIDFFSDWLGPYAYGRCFAMVEVRGRLGCMENAGAVAMMVGAIQARQVAREMAVHEVAHHWFGDNLRIRNSGEFWMSEGFTSYLTYRFFQHTDGARAFHRMLDRSRSLVSAALRHRAHALEGPCYCDIHELFTDVPYELGPWILRMMETALGSPGFDRMLGAWYRAHRFAAVDTREFLRFARRQTGRDVETFFNHWSRIDAVPSFEDRSAIAGDRVRVHLRARTPVPEGVVIPLVVQGLRGEMMALGVDPRAGAIVETGFRVRRLVWDPERRVLAHVGPTAPRPVRSPRR